MFLSIYILCMLDNVVYWVTLVQFKYLLVENILKRNFMEKRVENLCFYCDKWKYTQTHYIFFFLKILLQLYKMLLINISGLNPPE